VADKHDRSVLFVDDLNFMKERIWRVYMLAIYRDDWSKAVPRLTSRRSDDA
jgi:hypothetical protein